MVERIRDGTELPRRVVIDAKGYATTPYKADVDHGITAQLCFVRRDGWTLAAPVALAGVAWALWPCEWVAVVPLPTWPRSQGSQI